MEEYRHRLGFAIGTGIVPGVMALLIIGLTSGEWGIAIAVGAVVWVATAAIYWGRYRHRR